VNAVTNHLVAEDLLDSQEGFCSMVFVPLYTGNFVSHVIDKMSQTQLLHMLFIYKV